MKALTPDKIENLFSKSTRYQKIDSIKISEPRIEMIHRRLNALLRVVQLESDGKPVEIDGFRLKDPRLWTSRIGTAFSELWHISTACNMRCPFCYEEMDPDQGSVLNEPPEMATMKEMETRLNYHDPVTGRGLFQPLTYINEIFCNPRVMDIMERIRAKAPREILSFVTNGTYLTEDVIARLANLKPLFFNFSVNSLNPEIRRRILVDRNPEVAIRAVNLLSKYRIPYLGSLVCWPTIPWEDVENTVRELDKAGCAIIRYSLSAYSRFFKGRPYNREEFWAKGLSVAKKLMKEVDTPIKVEPYHYMDRSFMPHVAGSIKGSPAWRAGIHSGDLITEIMGEKVQTSNQALSALSRTAKDGSRVTIILRRQGDEEEQEIILDDASRPFGYPYDQMLGFSGFEWGIILVDNLKFQYLKEMRTIIDKYSAKRVLLCSSEIMKPIVAQMIKESRAFDDIEILIEVPENRFFGGTVCLGDLLVVEDYIQFIKNYKNSTNKHIDLVVIPSSPFSSGEWLRDLTGRSFTDIERQVGMPVEVVNCTPIHG